MGELFRIPLPWLLAGVSLFAGWSAMTRSLKVWLIALPLLAWQVRIWNLGPGDGRLAALALLLAELLLANRYRRPGTLSRPLQTPREPPRQWRTWSLDEKESCEGSGSAAPSGGKRPPSPETQQAAWKLGVGISSVYLGLLILGLIIFLIAARQSRHLDEACFWPLLWGGVVLFLLAWAVPLAIVWFHKKLPKEQ